MAKIDDLFQTYSALDTGDLSGNQKKYLYNQLISMVPEDIQTIEEHKKFIALVGKLRQASMDDMELFGQKFLATLKSLLSVGEDGVYSNQLRFLYELIQNVDDCDYPDMSDCNLDIRFLYDKEPGRIILTYNEVGFTPENVFSITGIAEKSKNISADKVEIGEKGIGFKSVFGIARKVLIQSGYFSFELFADNFTVPISAYDDFEPVEGTKLTLEMSAKQCKGIYQSLANKYLSQEAMLNQNPILFLNKLTHLKLHTDNEHYIEFSVQRTVPVEHGSLLFEENVSVSVDMKFDADSLLQSQKKEILCYRYTMPIVYGQEECVSRYGADTEFTERRHNLIAILPVLNEDVADYHGVLYSFLPTQVETSAPIILHVPYKLGGSREFVDSNNNDAWFRFTNQKLVSFLEQVYLDLAQILKQKVIRYIPCKHRFFFRGDRGKVGCLMMPELKGDYICTKNVFYTEDGTFENLSKIVSFGIEENLNDPVEVFRLLEHHKKLFVPGFPTDMKWYGAQVIENVPGKLFAHGLEKPELFNSILQWLEKNVPALSYYRLLYANEPVTFYKMHLESVAKHGQLWNASIQNAHTQIVNKKDPPMCILKGEIPEISIGARTLLMNIIKDADLDYIFKEYLEFINYRFFVIDSEKEFAIAAKNGIVLANGRELGSFAKIARLFDRHGTFTASMEIRQVSEKLNQVDDSMSNQEYLTLLHGVRKSLVDAFGNRMYDSYIKIIAEAGTDKRRFLSELIQNADDCCYPENVVPSFRLIVKGSTLTVSYNECGFTKDNVRAITAIGESTKKLLLYGESQSIGEKGVGFKSVFGVAKSVEIHSNGFDFKLTNKLPTIPEACEQLEIPDGTVMVFDMKQDVTSSFSSEHILQLCLCLRNLKHLSILNHEVVITEDSNKRVVTVDGQRYAFERIEHQFLINDKEALSTRNTNGKTINPHQKIICYIPERIRGIEMMLYSGLPLEIRSNVPIIIDAPFELTTSRENILHNRWNEIVREELYKTILDVMYAKADSGLDVLRYVGFRTQNNVTTWQNFDDDYLNRFNWPEALRDAEILPILGTDRKISSNYKRCLLVPDFIAHMQATEDITQFFNGEVIDATGKNQYNPILEAIGCMKVSGDDIYRLLRVKTARFIQDGEFRDALYAYLSNNQGNTVFSISKEASTTLPIFPVRVSGTTRYIQYDTNIYAHETEESQDDYYILNTKVMSLKQADDILAGRGRINELTQEVFDAKYQKTLREYIENPKGQFSLQQTASFLLNEYVTNRRALSKCKPLLLGLMPKIPFQMSNGLYKVGNKYLNSRSQWYAGELIKAMVVNENYTRLAAFLECKEVENMHYEDIDYEINHITDDDIEDIQSDFVYYYEIIKGLINSGKISDEQILRYHLEFGVGIDADDDPYEEFPERPVRNIYRLKKHIQDSWKTNKNPYTEKEYIRWKPKYPMNKVNYSLSMYQSVNNENKCFCQMCRRLTSRRYIERNDIERNPAYAWEQMYLCLCLNCSKDYILLRNNEEIWKQFLHRIMGADPMHSGIVEIPLGDGNITFTSVHLAEVQEIFKNEGWGEDAPKRKPKMGHSINDEDEDFV